MCKTGGRIAAASCIPRVLLTLFYYSLYNSLFLFNNIIGGALWAIKDVTQNDFLHVRTGVKNSANGYDIGSELLRQILNPQPGIFHAVPLATKFLLRERNNLALPSTLHVLAVLI